MYNTILLFQSERPIFQREQANKMYGVFPYYMAKVIIDIPVMLITSFISSFIVYFGLWLEISFSQFLKYYLVLILEA
jgi:hypothetical protein